MIKRAIKQLEIEWVRGRYWNVPVKAKGLNCHISANRSRYGEYLLVINSKAIMTEKDNYKAFKTLDSAKKYAQKYIRKNFKTLMKQGLEEK